MKTATKQSKKWQVKNLFNVSPGHEVTLEQLLAITPKYTQRISDLRKDGLFIECIDKNKGIYRYYPKEIIQERFAV